MSYTYIILIYMQQEALSTLATAFIPHGHCYLWKSGLLLLNIGSDFFIAVAYFLIPMMLIYLVDKREDIPFDWIFLCFGAFIIFCGMTHAVEIWTLWHANYWVSGWLKFCTALISVMTACLLFSLLPKLIAIPNVPQLSALNTSLEKEIVQRQQIATELEIKTQQLEATLLKLQQTQAQVVHTEKMSSLGQMVAGIAHEINNPVSFVYSNLVPAYEYAQDLIGLLELYQQSFPNPPEIITDRITDIELDFLKEDFIKLINSMKIGAERIAQIVSSLRNFSRLDEAELKEANINEGIDNTLMILGNRLRNRKDLADIKLIKEYDELPLVKCYPGQLNQALMNILVNAIDALDEKNIQRLQDNLEPQLDTIKINTKFLDENRIEIRISDNALGIPKIVHSKIFDPFFTTKDVGKGTGLGLSICYQIIVDEHGGKLSFESSLDKGTEFIIEIPTDCTKATLEGGKLVHPQ